MHRRAVAALIALAACREPPLTHRYTVSFVARTDRGAPVAGVTVEANGKPLGATGPDGGLAVDLRAPEGKRLAVTTTCPSGFRTLATDTDVRLRRVGRAGEPLTISTECRPSIRRAVVLVRTPRLAGVPIRFRDREIARTDADGVAHVLLTMAPGTRFQLDLDTSAHPRLRPRDPTQSFEMPDADQLFVFDYQPIASPAPKKKRRKRTAAAPPPGPVKIQSLHDKHRR